MDATREKNRARHSLERRVFSWQAATLLNIAILLATITVALVGRFSPTFGRSQARPLKETEAAGSRFHPVQRHGEHIPFNIADARLDDFGTIAPAEFYEVLLRASPEELAGLALRFNDLPNNTRTMAGLGMFFQAWAELDGKTALAGAYRIRDVRLRRIAANTVLLSASPSVAPDLAAFLVAYPDKNFTVEVRNDLLDAVISRWADMDPEGAAKFLENMPDADIAIRQSAGSNIAFSWGTLDPNAALQWLERQSDNTEILFNSVVNGWSKSDSAAAGAYVIQHLDRPGAFEAASSVLLTMVNEDPNSAAKWLRQLPAGDVSANAQQILASTWAEKDPLAAAQWAEGLDKEDRARAAGTIANIWKNHDWAETQQWLGTISGDFRDAAIAGALTNDYQSRVSPSEALPLALSMMDRQNRNTVVQRVIERWASDEPQAAIQWIQTSVLSREEKEGLLSLEVFTQQRYQP